MEDLKETEIEKLRQIISRTDKSGNEKLLLLMDFIYTREAALRKADVIKSVCDCDDEHVCGICFRSKGYDIINGKLEQTVL